MGKNKQRRCIGKTLSGSVISTTGSQACVTSARRWPRTSKRLFFAHPQWPVFLTRHGVKEFSGDMGGRQHCFFCFDGEGCRIRMTDTFRGEIVRDETSSRFSIEEICGFLSDTEYYTSLLERAEAKMRAKEKRAAEEEEKTEYALYRRLKVKFEG